jgi:dolichyl-phosphate-mannose--protein O-mannosyl transferase
MSQPDSSPPAGKAATPKRTASFAWLHPTPLCALIAAMLALGIFLRVYAFDYPSNFLFDEHHFVENARNYLHNKADWNDHPPLGKLIIAQSILALGDTSTGWRLPSLLFGLLTIVVGGFSAARLFKSARAGWLAAAFLSVDGFLIAYSRGALLDGFLAFSLALALLIVTLPVNVWTALAAGLVAGFALSIKFSGIAVVLPCVLMLLFARLPLKRLLGYATVFGAALVAVYFAQYARGLALAGQASGPLDVINDTHRLLDHHAGLTDMKNPWVSGWITWFLPVRPVMLAHGQHVGASRILTSLGNIALWWSATLALAVVVGIFLTKGIAWALAPADRDNTETWKQAPVSFVKANGHSVLLVLSGCFGFLAPWILTHRDSYIYHYLPSYLALLLLLAGIVDWLGRSRYRQLLGYVGIVLLVAAFYAPVWSTLEISPAAVPLRLFLGSWR